MTQLAKDELDRKLEEVKSANWKLKYYTQMRDEWRDKILVLNVELQTILLERAEESR